MARFDNYRDAVMWLSDYEAKLETPSHHYAVGHIKRAAHEQRANLEVVKRRGLSNLFDLPQYERSVRLLENAAAKLD